MPARCGPARATRPLPQWIADLLAHGLIRPSFVPPPAISALRDLTRTRVALVQTRTQAKAGCTRCRGYQHQAEQCGGRSVRHQWPPHAGGLDRRRARRQHAGGAGLRKAPAQTAAAGSRSSASLRPIMPASSGALETIDLLDRQIAGSLSRLVCSWHRSRPRSRNSTASRAWTSPRHAISSRRRARI